MAKYRIVRDSYSGFEAQYKVWWWPFWIQCGWKGMCTNTSPSIELAEQVAQQHAKSAKGVVKSLGRLAATAGEKS